MTKRERFGLLEDAIQVALDNHRGETDRDGQVFIRHPLRVMEKVPDAARVVAVLHDVLEDGGTIEPVRMRLTAEGLQALDLLTRKGLGAPRGGQDPCGREGLAGRRSLPERTGLVWMDAAAPHGGVAARGGRE